jgi:hypothetical protein
MLNFTATKWWGWIKKLLIQWKQFFLKFGWLCVPRGRTPSGWHSLIWGLGAKTQKHEFKIKEMVTRSNFHCIKNLSWFLYLFLHQTSIIFCFLLLCVKLFVVQVKVFFLFTFILLLLLLLLNLILFYFILIYLFLKK